jgi:streptogramin lyase
MEPPVNVEIVFKAPEPHPNGMQFCGEGLWIADQASDRVTLVDPTDGKAIRSMETESTNTSGVTLGGGALWLSVNGPLKMSERPPVGERTSAQGQILKIDMWNGQTLGRYPMPDGKGIHGIEWDDNTFWVTIPGARNITQINAADFRVLHVIPVPLGRAHGLVREGDSIWCVHTTDRVIVKLDIRDGRETDRISLPSSSPEPHCLSARDGKLWYCDAWSGDICRITR